jgi:hypothetical protein
LYDTAHRLYSCAVSLVEGLVVVDLQSLAVKADNWQPIDGSSLAGTLMRVCKTMSKRRSSPCRKKTPPHIEIL